MPINIISNPNDPTNGAGQGTPIFQQWSCPNVVLTQPQNGTAVSTTLTYKIKDFVGSVHDAQYSAYRLELNTIQPTPNLIAITGYSFPLALTNGTDLDLTFTVENYSILDPNVYLLNLTFKVMGLNASGHWDFIESKSATATVTIQDSSPNAITISPAELYLEYVEGTEIYPYTNITINSDVPFQVIPSDLLAVDGEAPGQVIDFTDYTGAMQIDLTEAIDNYSSGTSILRELKVKRLSDGLIYTILVHISIAPVPFTITPHNLDFYALFQSLEAESQTLSIFTNNEPYTIESHPSWLQLQNNILSSEIIVTPIETNNILPGELTGEIIIKSQNVEKTVSVTYLIEDFTSTEGLEYYFTHDLHYLNLSTFNENTFFRLELEITKDAGNGTEEVVNRSLNVALFNKKAKVHLGNEVHNIIKNNSEIELWESEFKKQRNPLKINIVVKEMINFLETILREHTIDTLYYYKGRTPKTWGLESSKIFLQHDENIVRATPNSIMSVSFMKKDDVYLSIFRDKNGTQTNVNSVLSNERGIFTIFRKFNDLVPGDLVSFRNGFSIKEYLVIPDQENSNHIYYLSEWDTEEVFELTGEYSFEAENEYSDFNNYTLFKNILVRLQHTQNIVFTINTGWVFENNTTILDAICRSRKCWVKNGGEKIEIIPTTESYTLSESDNDLYSYNLTFSVNKKYD